MRRLDLFSRASVCSIEYVVVKTLIVKEAITNIQIWVIYPHVGNQWSKKQFLSFLSCKVAECSPNECFLWLLCQTPSDSKGRPNERTSGQRHVHLSVASVTATIL